MKEIISCSKCDLYKNQQPLLQKNINTCDVFFVGLSAVKVEDVNSSEPFDINTKSGSLLHSINNMIPEQNIYFTNTVKCLPLKEDKIRYPNKSEMEQCYNNFGSEFEFFEPKKMVLFGKQVSNYLVKKILAEKDCDFGDDLNFSSFHKDELKILCAPHPSYILIYKRKYIDEYRDTIVRFLKK